MSNSHPHDGLSEELSEKVRAIVDDAEASLSPEDSESDVPDWRTLEEIGAGDGPETECERCGKLDTPRQQFEHVGVTICFVCADERVAKLGAEGPWV